MFLLNNTLGEHRKTDGENIIKAVMKDYMSKCTQMNVLIRIGWIN